MRNSRPNIGSKRFAAASALLLAPAVAQAQPAEFQVTEEARLQRETPGSAGGFGTSLALSGDRLVVGAPFEFAHDNPAAGAAYVFERVPGPGGEVVWELAARLVSPVEHSRRNGFFGFSVAVAGGAIYVGAPRELDGAVYVFEQRGSDWTEVSRRDVPSAPGNGDFGWSLATAGATLAVGAPGLDDAEGFNTGGVFVIWKNPLGGFTLVPLPNPFAASPSSFYGHAVAGSTGQLAAGNPGHDVGDTHNAGAVAILRRGANDRDWVPEATVELAAPVESARLGGFGLALSDEWLAAGYHADPRGDFGAVALFERDGERWREAAAVMPEQPARRSEFGVSLSLSGGRLAVGAPNEERFGIGAGAVFIFDRSGGEWVQAAVLEAPESRQNSRFGAAVLIDEGRLLAGAPGPLSNPEPEPVAFLLQILAAGAPTVLEQPSSTTAQVGGEAVFSIAAEGADLTYQWRRDGVDLPGEDGRELRLGGLGFADNGGYTVRVSGSGGAVESETARLTVGGEGLFAGDWASAGGDAQNRRFSPMVVGVDRRFEATAAWERALTSNPAGAVAGGGRLIIATTKSNDPPALGAFDLQTGRRLWQREFPRSDEVEGLALTGDLVVVRHGGLDKEVWALDVASGDTVWSRGSGELLGWPVPAPGDLVVFAADSVVGTTGVDISHHSQLQNPNWIGAVDGTVSYYFATGLVAADARTEIVDWELPLEGVVAHGRGDPRPIVVEGQQALLVSYNPDQLVAIDLDERRVSWTLEGGVGNNLAVAGSSIYTTVPLPAAGASWALQELSAADGEVIHTFTLPGPLSFPPTVTAEFLFAPTEGETLIFSTRGRTLLQTLPRDGELVLSDGVLAMVERGGRVTAFRLGLENRDPTLPDPDREGPPPATVDVPYRWEVTGVDPDLGDRLTLEVRERPGWLDFTALGGGRGLLSGVPGQDDVGEAAVMISLADASGSEVGATYSFDVLSGVDPDSDGDGFTDAEEAALGLDPENGGSRFALAPPVFQPHPDGGLLLLFPVAPGFDFIVEHKASLLDPTWVTLGQLDGEADDGRFVHRPAAGEEHRFYRVRAVARNGLQPN